MDNRFMRRPAGSAPSKQTDYPRYKKIALFIDGANFFVSAKVCGFDVDWKRFLSHYRGEGDLFRAYYYTGILPKVPGKTDPLKPTLDWIVYNGFTLRTKIAKIFKDPLSGKETIKGNMDLEMAIDMLDVAAYVTDIYIFSGDGDFTPLVQRVQAEGVRVHVVSTIVESNPMCADDLRRQCDFFYELATMRGVFERNEE